MSVVRFHLRPPSSDYDQTQVLQWLADIISIWNQDFLVGMDSSKVNQCVEALCQCGCEVVRATIDSMELGLSPVQTQGLEKDEIASVLCELKSIMAVYDGNKKPR